MAPQKRDSKDYDRLKKLGFEFRNERGEYNAQPDSGSTIGGTRGLQEYGIIGDVATEDIDFTDPDLDNTTNEIALSSASPLQFDAQNIGGMSEWSAENALDEEEVIEGHLRRDALKPLKTGHLRKIK